MVKFAISESEAPKLRQIMETAKHLLRKYGIKRVTIEEICREAGVSKVTFYKYFENKTDLVIYLLDETIEKALSDYRKMMDSDIPFEEKIAGSLRMKMEGTQDLSEEMIRDILGDADPKITSHYRKLGQKSLEMVVEDYSKAQQEGHIRQDIKIEFILFFLNNMVEMLKDQHLMAMYQNSQEAIMELMNFFFWGIMERGNRK